MPITADMIGEPADDPTDKTADSDLDKGKRRRKRKTQTPHEAAAPTPEEAREGYEMPAVGGRKWEG